MSYILALDGIDIGPKKIKFKDLLKEKRNENCLTQKEVAEKLGLTRQTYSKYEKGTANPRFDILILISQLYKIPIDNLMTIHSEEFNRIKYINYALSKYTIEELDKVKAFLETL